MVKLCWGRMLASSTSARTPTIRRALGLMPATLTRGSVHIMCRFMDNTENANAAAAAAGDPAGAIGERRSARAIVGRQAGSEGKKHCGCQRQSQTHPKQTEIDSQIRCPYGESKRVARKYGHHGDGYEYAGEASAAT